MAEIFEIPPELQALRAAEKDKAAKKATEERAAVAEAYGVKTVEERSIDINKEVAAADNAIADLNDQIKKIEGKITANQQMLHQAQKVGLDTTIFEDAVSAATTEKSGLENSLGKKIKERQQIEDFLKMRKAA